MITIYERDATDFTGNGLGKLTPKSCTVTETMNGAYEVTLVHPIDEAGKFKRIAEERIIRVPVPAGKTPRISMNIAGSVGIYRITTDGRRLYLRAAPNQSAKGIRAYEPGTEVVVIDNTTHRQWSEVVTPDGRHGWMWTGNLEYVRTEASGSTAEDEIKEPVTLREQPFRIYKIEPTLTGITAYARHVFYDLMDNMVSSYKPGKTTKGAAAFVGLAEATEDGHEFTFYSDLESTAEDVEIIDKNPAEAIMDADGLIDCYGGELMRDWWDVYLAKRIGEETDIQIREGKNLLGIKYSTDLTNVVTRIIPRGEDADGNKLYLPERYVENTAENKPVYARVKWHVLDVKEAKEKKSGDEKRTKDECYALMREAAAEAFKEGWDLPDVTLNVDFIDCAQTEEYRQYRQLESIHLGDTVRVVAKRVGVEVAMRMTQYGFDCLTKKYTKMTLGTIDATIDGNRINPRSIGSGTIKGGMIALGGIGAGQIADGAVNGLKIALAAIGYAHIDEAAINQLSANAITAIRADIRELVAGNITTDQLYADLAVIAAAQITAANIEKANIQWAQIKNLAAEIARVVNAEIKNAEIDWAQIKNAQIDAADIANLTATVAVLVKAEIALAEIDWARIKNVEVDTAQIKLGAITQALIAAGAIGTAQIADGSITSAKIVELTADLIKTGTLSAERLLIKGAGGLFYEINAQAGNLTSTQLTEEQYKNAISGTALVARSVTADKIAAKSITANEILSGTITAVEINVANLFAAEATIAALNSYIIKTSTIEALKGSLDVWASDKIRLAVDNVQVGGRNLLKAEGMQFGGSCALWNLESWHSRNGLRIGFLGTGEVSFEDIYISPGDYTLSFYGWRWAADANPTLYFDLKSADGSFEHNVIVTKLEDTSQGGSVKKYVGTLHVDTYSGKVKPRFVILDAFSTGDVGITEWKLERGNKATDWSPAPEDTDAAIAELSAAITVQDGEITSNAQKIETVSQAAGNAQNTANAARNEASGASTRVTKAEQRISAVEGAITSKVSKTEFDELGRLVSAQETRIEQTDEQVLILAGKTVGGRNHSLGTGTPYTATGNGGWQQQFPWNCASVEEANSLYGQDVTISFDYETAITSGSFRVMINTFWYVVEEFSSYGNSGHVSKTFAMPAATISSSTFIYIEGAWTGSVTFKHLKLEKGNTATDWSPHPQDPASGVDAGGVVRVDQTGVHMSGGTIEMETSDGDEYIHIRNDGISASSLSAPNVAKRYSGPTGLYVNPNATSAQIAAGNYFRSLSDALATVNNRMLDYNVFITMASGMSDYTDAVISGVYGDGAILIYGENATVYGTVTVRNSHAQVIISSLHVAIPSGVERAAYEVRNAFLTIYSSTMSGNYRAFTVDVNGYLDARSCVFKVNAENSAYVLRATASFEECIGNGRMLCHRGNMTAYGKVPIGGASYWESCMPNNLSSLIPTGTDGTPAAPVIQTASWNYLYSDSYGNGWGNFSDDDVRQGYIASGQIYGVMWFDAAAIRSALSGKTIKQVSLRLHMHTGVGRSQPVSVQLYGANVNYSNRVGRPETTKSYGTIGTTRPGEVNEITIPAQAVADMVSGATNALVLLSDDTALYKDRAYSQNYARFSGSTSATAETCPRLTVVYQ